MKLKKTFLLQIILIVLLLFPMFSATVQANDETNSAPATEATDNNIIEKTELNLYSKSCILIDCSTNQPVYEKNADERLYPASTTKLLTAIIAVENCHLEDTVTITYEMTSAVPKNYTSVYLRPGEQVTVEELLNSLLIPSGNDAGFALAIHISGSVDEFAKLMNEKAKEIGCTNSNFTNPSGIQNSEHYSTARDLAKIGLYAKNYPQITNIVCKTSFTLHQKKANMRTFETTNTLIKPSSKSYYEYATGMKTGFTDEAGACLISTAKKDDMEYLAVVLGAPESKNGINYRDLDSKTLFEFGFNNYNELTKIYKLSLNISKTENQIKLPIKLSSNVPITVIYEIALALLAFILLLAILSIVKRKRKK